MPSQPEQDWREQPSQLKLEQFHFQIAMEFSFIAFLLLVGDAWLFKGDGSYWSNVYVMITGFGITIRVIDRLNRRRDEQNAIKQLKEQLVRDASSMVNDVANNAIHQMRKREWLEGEDGLLTGADLSRANLANANLRGANLQEARLDFANLQGTSLEKANLANANLRGANLQEARLDFANLQGTCLDEAILQKTALAYAELCNADLRLTELQEANLTGAILREANLKRANLRAANLSDADLQGVDLQNANLQEANLLAANICGANLKSALLKNARLGYGADETKYNETTLLPDGRYSTAYNELSWFTNPIINKRFSHE